MRDLGFVVEVEHHAIHAPVDPAQRLGLLVQAPSLRLDQDQAPDHRVLDPVLDRGDHRDVRPLASVLAEIGDRLSQRVDAVRLARAVARQHHRALCCVGVLEIVVATVARGLVEVREHGLGAARLEPHVVGVAQLLLRAQS